MKNQLIPNRKNSTYNNLSILYENHELQLAHEVKEKLFDDSRSVGSRSVDRSSVYKNGGFDKDLKDSFDKVEVQHIEILDSDSDDEAEDVVVLPKPIPRNLFSQGNPATYSQGNSLYRKPFFQKPPKWPRFKSDLRHIKPKHLKTNKLETQLQLISHFTRCFEYLQFMVYSVFIILWLITK